MKLNCPYLPLINSFDAVGWIPTIRGSLSLSLFNNSNSIFGDIDKFSIEFKYYNNFVSSRYLVASSLFTTDDNKSGENYCRTFRYVFRGTINDSKKQSEFIRKNNLRCDFFKEEDLLIGKLSIIGSISDKCTKRIKYTKFTKRKKNTKRKKLTEKERRLLQSLMDLSEKKKEFQKEFSEKAASCDRLKVLRYELKRKWEKVEKNIIRIETTKNPCNLIYKFDVILSRDGILFLKDDTANYFIGQDENGNYIYLRDTYRKGDTADDFTQNVPIHRLFKTAMNYVKFLFHENYHHNNNDDAFLPATNLHPIKNSGRIDKIVKHQIEHFLTPIVKLKRDNFRDFIFDPLGIIQYADSFLCVFKNKGFISKKDAGTLHKFIEKQKNEIEILLSENNAIKHFFLTQQTIPARITFSFAVLLGIIETFKFLSHVPEISVFLESQPQLNFRIRIYIIIFGLAFGYCVKKYAEVTSLSKRFKRRNKSNSIFNQNSNVKKGRLSFLYALRLYLLDWRINKKIVIEIIKGFLLITLLITSVLLLIILFFKNVV